MRRVLGVAALFLVACNQDLPVIVHPLGGKASPRNVMHTSHAPRDLTNVPASADLSQFNPPVADQGQVGDCTSWGVGYAFGGWLANQSGNTGLLFAPMYVFMQAAPSGSTDFGMDPYQVFGMMQTGIDTAVDYDTVMTNTFKDSGASIPGRGDDAAANDNTAAPSAAAMQNASQYQIGQFETVYSTYPGSKPGVCPGYAGGTAPIQATIAGGQPVVVVIPVPPEFDNYNGVVPVAPPTATEKSRGEHVILCDKYDSTGLWCQNSWGTDWGKAGWVELSWPFVEQCVIESDTASGFTAPAPSTPTPTPSPTATATPVSTPTPVVPPTAAITSPADGGTVSGTITVNVQITYGTNLVAFVYLESNGVILATGNSVDSTGNAAITFDTTTVTDGSETLYAVALDVTGVDSPSSATITVTVAN